MRFHVTLHLEASDMQIEKIGIAAFLCPTACRLGNQGDSPMTWEKILGKLIQTGYRKHNIFQSMLTKIEELGFFLASATWRDTYSNTHLLTVNAKYTTPLAWNKVEHHNNTGTFASQKKPTSCLAQGTLLPMRSGQQFVSAR